MEVREKRTAIRPRRGFMWPAVIVMLVGCTLGILPKPAIAQFQAGEPALPSTTSTPLERAPGDSTCKASSPEPATSSTSADELPILPMGGGDTCATATVIPGIPFSDAGTTCGATDDYNVNCPFGGPTAPDVVYSYTPTTDVSVNISLCRNTLYNSKLFVYANTCPGTVVGCDDDACSNESYPNSYLSRLDGLPLLAGNTYYIVIDGFFGQCGDYTIDVTFASPGGGDTCAAATVITSLPFSDSGRTCGKTDDYSGSCGGAGSPEVVYSYTPQVNTKLNASLCDGSGYDSVLYVFENVCPGNEVACSDDACYYKAADIEGLSLTAGNTYYIVVDGYDGFNGNCGSYVINVTGEPACALEPPPGSTLESETCGSTTNDGCNMATPVFEPIVPGQTVYGTAWQTSSRRDTDWYQVDLTTTTILTWTVQAEFPVQTGLLAQKVPGVPGCANLTNSLSPSALGEGNCEPLELLTAPLAPGTYYLFVSTGYSWSFGCAANNHYVATLTSVPASPEIRVEPPALTFNCTSEDSHLARQGSATPSGQDAPHLQPDSSPPGKLVAAQEITQSLTNNNGRADVIVSLSKPMTALAATDFNSPRSLKALQKDIDQRQAAVLATLPANEFTLRHRYQNMAAFSGSISKEGLARLQKDPGVASIEPVRLLEAHLAQGIPLINGMAYRSLYNGAGVAIAICDTGIDYTHPMLGGGAFPNAKVIGGYDFGEDDPDPMPVGQAHGTCCAGIAAGDLGTTGDYIGGVAHNARLYAVKIAPDNSGSASSDAMVAAWDWCVTHKNDDPNNPILVISTSFGGGRYLAACDTAGPAMTTAAANAAAAGISITVSAGNDGYCDAISWPACISSVISVGAVYDDSFGTLRPCVSRYSCAAKTSTTGCQTGYYATDNAAADLVTSYSNSAGILTVFAPSNQAYTTDIVGSTGYTTGDYYPSFGGTSAACPYTAGSIACLQQAAKAITGSYLSPFSVKSTLTLTGDPIADAKIPSIIKPRVNLGHAIESLAPCAGQTLTIHNDGNMSLNILSLTASPWLTLNPAPTLPYSIPAGAEIDFCVTMNCTAACAPGTQLEGSIQIASDDADGPMVTIPVHATCPAIPDDFDHDGDVDSDDFTTFASCFSGPTVHYSGSEPCESADADDDLDVDQADFGVFQQCFSGSNRRADPSCAD